MKRTEPQSVGDVLRLAIQDSDMARRLDEVKATLVWTEIVSPAIAQRCGKPRVDKGIMTIPVASAALRHELTMSRTSLIRHINSRIGRDTLSDIRFTS